MNLTDYSGAPSGAFDHDDIWISGNLALNGIKRLVHAEPFAITGNDLPNGVNSDTMNFIVRLILLINYFRQKDVFNEKQTASFWKIMVLELLS